ncbi:hypothetical protein A3C91_04655 [Candidatus Azambacteria bacterium RIFCSPHIGHO2_02_FULL_52_12]|uniref:VTT domain-containing protein n=1 Tax=Candidatus Azambacteria bacterium RIFCSPLOWO2_01_FULL_46_25 TaxID=1797298 RepID=A0A1F5BV58_9BACT|nr:MAG: hypothetical protein A3C91_04655 [Candidatus Azambacteria bacterium RIFCSPHIGHO2_02_FULL_52_12]OGD34490.1 MAG: hypothetical protein A2988_03150 [Candidatus Azambacteria bacterium RIFCSPLOWO2_01_FULL_46_25]OGD38025.1 MAG: hypothetical protein A2850_02950 [Candidatus Azambacteria bacterium RIFCSPHIGHO2_01_FULL_51_74]
MIDGMDWYEIFTGIASYVEYHRYTAYTVIFFASFLEAIPFAGLIVPGNILLVMTGILSFEGYLDKYDALAFAVAGAILGDLGGYAIGAWYRKAKRKLADIEQEEENLFKKSYFEKTERFFAKHGGKSVFFGRFIGPLRPFTPFFAGLSAMRIGRFMYYNVASALLWACGFFFLGYIFEESLRSVKRIEHVILIVIIVGGASYALHVFFKKKAENGGLPKEG